MNKKQLQSLFALGLLCSFSSLVIWFSVYFGVWHPYFSVNWKDSQCIAQRLDHFYWTIASKSSTIDQRYTNIHVLVDINGVWVPGFACGSPNSKLYTLGTPTLTDEYPYKSGTCPEPDVCGKQVLLPMWYCRECFGCEDVLTGQSTPCKWSIGGDESGEGGPDTWANSKNLPYPMVSGQYLQVVLGSEVFYNKDELLALHSLCAIGFFLPIFIFVIARCWFKWSVTARGS